MYDHIFMISDVLSPLRDRTVTYETRPEKKGIITEYFNNKSSFCTKLENSFKIFVLIKLN